MEPTMSKKSVEIFQRDGKWIVRVADAGEAFERDFDHPPHAKSFGSGQAFRLGVTVTGGDDIGRLNASPE